eukprot:scaffold29647_cov145-Isochrysis_galbana.AAC.5
MTSSRSSTARARMTSSRSARPTSISSTRPWSRPPKEASRSPTSRATLGPLCSTAFASASPISHSAAAVGRCCPSIPASAAALGPAARFPFFAHPSPSAPPPPIPIRFQIDGGSNANILSDTAAAALSDHARPLRRHHRRGIVPGVCPPLPCDG